MPLDNNTGELIASIGRVGLAAITAENGMIMNSKEEARAAFEKRSQTSVGGVTVDVLIPSYFY